MIAHKVVGIHQPNFLPWLGYFHKMVRSDVFVLLNDVQYSKNSVGNRSYIRRKDGIASYLTAPVRLSKKAFQNYNEIELDYGPRWPHKGLNMIKDAYQKAPYFKKVFPDINDIFLKHHPHLASLNIELIQYVMNYMQIQTPLVLSENMPIDDVQKSDLVLEISKHLGATIYLSGNGARAYNDEQKFNANHIRIVYTQFTLDDMYKARDEKNELVHLSILHFLFNYEVSLIREMIDCPSIASYTEIT
jgi:hypothetical protein